MKTKLLFLIIFALGLFARLYQVEWDNHTHLHPDERFLTMVSADIKMPTDIAQYFNTATSPLNPTNYESYRFFVYGTFPIILTRFIGEKINQVGYDEIYILGRILSAFVDSLVIIFLYLLASKIFPTKKYLALIPPFFYAFSPLPLQLSHYYAVDTYLSAFIFISFVLLSLLVLSKRLLWLVLASVFFGLALSSKITALYFGPIIAILILSSAFTNHRLNFLHLVRNSLLFAVLFLLVFRVFQPYAFINFFDINPVFVENLKTLAAQSKPDAYFPPSVQWLSKTKLIFPFKNLVWWGIGLPFFVFFIYTLLNFVKRQTSFRPVFDYKFIIGLSAILWILILFFYQGSQFTYAMRYFLPIYPFIYFVALYLLSTSVSNKLILFFLTTHFLWGLSFLSIYARPQTRIQASQWIYQNVSPGSTLTNEYWDDPLPLYLPGGDPYTFNGQMLPFYDPESDDKWANINPILSKADYIIMSSNRLWDSITRVPHQYPQTTKYYQNLFDEKSGFKLAAKFVSYPGFIIPFMKSCLYFGPSDYPYVSKQNSWFEKDVHCRYPGVYFRDDTADESFTVYDHPQVLIYKRQ